MPRKIKALYDSDYKPKKQKKRKLKKAPQVPKINDDFLIVGCDLSLRCPGFALFRYVHAERRVELVRMSIVHHRKSANLSHGELLNDIANEFTRYIRFSGVAVVVRERGISKFNTATQAIFKVVGVTDMVCWQFIQHPIQEITCTEARKLVSGVSDSSVPKSKKEKALVAAEYLDDYFEHRKFATDDESDACIVAIGWLIKEGYLDQSPRAAQNRTRTEQERDRRKKKQKQLPSSASNDPQNEMSDAQ